MAELRNCCFCDREVYQSKSERHCEAARKGLCHNCWACNIAFQPMGTEQIRSYCWARNITFQSTGDHYIRVCHCSCNTFFAYQTQFGSTRGDWINFSAWL